MLARTRAHSGGAAHGSRCGHATWPAATRSMRSSSGGRMRDDGSIGRVLASQERPLHGARVLRYDQAHDRQPDLGVDLAQVGVHPRVVAVEHQRRSASIQDGGGVMHGDAAPGAALRSRVATTSTWSAARRAAAVTCDSLGGSGRRPARRSEASPQFGDQPLHERPRHIQALACAVAVRRVPVLSRAKGPSGCNARPSSRCQASCESRSPLAGRQETSELVPVGHRRGERRRPAPVVSRSTSTVAVADPRIAALEVASSVLPA